MSVVDEVWCADANRIQREGRGDPIHPDGTWVDCVVGLMDVVEGDAMNDGCSERARLAACAPEALKLLDEIEWSGAATNSYSEVQWRACPSCGGVPSDVPEDGLSDSNDGTTWHRGHRDDCALHAVLKKAGLR